MGKAEEQPRSVHSIEVPAEIIGKWQDFVNLLAEIMHVPSASIMRAEPPHIRIFVSSTSEGNPCEPGALDTGPYCETVMKTGQPLLVPDALENEAWKANPHVRLGMISYLGVPISWPDGRIFGTICVRDNKRNEYSEAYLKLLLHFRDMLQIDLKSLERLHGEIEEREAKIRRLVDANIIGIFIWDFDGRILEANEAFLDIVGHEHEDLAAGRIRWTDLTPPEWRDRDAQLVQEHLKNGSLRPFEKEYFRKDGSRVPVLIGVATFEEGGNQGVAFVLDLTRRKRAEERLRVQHTVAQILAEAVTIEEAMPKILLVMGECLGWDVGVLWRVDREAEALRCVELWHEASIEVPEFEKVSRELTFGPGLGLPGRVWSSLRPEYIPDVVPDENFPRASVAEREGLRAAFGFPILLGGEVLGVIEFFSREIRQPDQELLDVLATIGSQIGQFIERRRGEEALRESEAKFRDYAEIASDWFWETDHDHKFTRVTDYERRLARGFAATRRTGLARWEFATDVEAEPEKWKIHRSVLEARQPFRDFVYPGERRGGSLVYYKISGKPVFDASGEFRGYRGTGTDVTAIMRAQEALRESEKSLQTIIDTIPALVVRYRADGAPDFMNRTTREFVGPGVGLEEMKSAVHPDDIPQNLRDWSERVAAGEPHENEMRLRRADGAYRWHHIRRVPLRDANGTIVSWYGAGHDIDDQKRAEAALRKNERNLQTIIDTIPGYVVRYRPDGTTDFVNQTLREFVGLGVRPDEMGSTVHPDDHPQALRKWQAHVAAGEPCELEMRMRRAADGVYRWQHTKRVPLRDANGTIVNWYGAGFDIDDQKCAEQALRRSEAYLAEAQRLTHCGVTAYKGATVFYGSEEIYRIWGFDPAEGVPSRKEVIKRVHPDDADRLNAEVERALSEKRRYSIAYRIVLPDGTLKHLETIGQPVFSTNGELVEVVATQLDVTERKRAEQALRESEAHLAEAQRELQAMIDTIPAMVGSYDAKGSLTYANKTALDYTGVTVVEGMTERRPMLVHPDDRDQTYNQWRASVATGEPFETELRLRRCDGEYRWVSTRRVPLRDSSGKVVRWYGAAIDIEDRKRAEAALHEREAQLIDARRELLQMIDALPLQVARYSADMKREFVNAAWKDFTGVSEEAALGTGWPSAVHPDDVAVGDQAWRDTVARGEPVQAELRLRRADGEYRWYHVYRVAMRNENGKVTKWYSTGYDIEERKRAELAVREREAQLIEARRELQETIDTIPIPVGRYSVRKDTGTARRDFVNAAWKQYTGLSDEEAIGSEWSIVIDPDQIAPVEKMWRKALATGEPLHTEERVRRFDGQYRWFCIDRVAVRDENGDVVRWYGTAYDIEDRKRAEDALRESEAHLAEAQRLSHTGAVRYNGTAILYASEETFHIWGFDPAQGLPSRDVVFQRIHPADRDRLNAEVRRAVSKERSRFSIAYRIVLPDGTIKHLETIGQPLYSASGKLVEIFAMQTDVTDRKRAEDALRRSEAYLAEAQRLSVTGSFGWRIADNLIVWSQETYRIFELDPAVKPTIELVLGRTHRDDVDLVRVTIERMAKEDREFDFEHRLLLPNGTIKHLQVRAHRGRFEHGEMEVVGALMDVTASRKAEEALRRAQAELAHASRVATLGELTASIAHEVNQPLGSIVASGEAAIRWLDRELPEKERAQRAITRLLNEAHRASQVIRRIRELAKKAEPEMAQVDINSLVKEVVTLVRREAVSQRVAVQTQLASGLPPVRGDRIQLQQVLINMVINGVQAMASVTDRARVLVICTQRHGDDELLVAVEDAGVGIEPENLARLFSAFYTTKPDGMGMGLSISRSIVEAHGGQVWATRNSGPGMTFQFTLSAYDEQASA